MSQRTAARAQKMLLEAAQLYRTGQLAETERRYSQLLIVIPQNAEALEVRSA